GLSEGGRKGFKPLLSRRDLKSTGALRSGTGKFGSGFGGTRRLDSRTPGKRRIAVATWAQGRSHFGVERGHPAKSAPGIGELRASRSETVVRQIRRSQQS